MKIILCTAFVLFVLFGCIGLAGLLLQPSQSATVERNIASRPESVWRVLTDVARQPEWRSELARVEVLDSTPGRERWKEQLRHGPTMEFKTTKQEPGTYWELSFFGSVEGRWKGRLEELPDGSTRIVVEESVSVHNPWMRVISRLFFNPGAIAEKYLADLAGAVERSSTTN